MKVGLLMIFSLVVAILLLAIATTTTSSSKTTKTRRTTKTKRIAVVTTSKRNVAITRTTTVKKPSRNGTSHNSRMLIDPNQIYNFRQYNNPCTYTFTRGDQAFYAMNCEAALPSSQPGYFYASLVQTGMAPGRYCDVATGGLTSDRRSCVGRSLWVDSNGKADIYMAGSDYNGVHPLLVIRPSSMLVETYATRRTVIFIKYQSTYGQNVFLRGGISNTRRSVCTTSPSACNLPILYSHTSYTAAGYAAYNAWSQGDRYIDWRGAEVGQASYDGANAEGSPMVWTSNLTSNTASFNPMNTYGEHYWMLDVMIDCNAAVGGWFELKGFVNGNWEADIKQNSACTGSAGSTTPYTTNNHIARCGYKNVFFWNQPSCQIDVL